jgi:UDP-galactopyranose mutase
MALLETPPATGTPTVRRLKSGSNFDVIVVGAGFAGSVMAERAASMGLRVLVVDTRQHIAGNAYDFIDEWGVLAHRYGPHLFHTNAAVVSDYLSRFTAWHPYEHRVKAVIDGQYVPVPINRTTVNLMYGLNLETEDQVTDFYARVAEPREMHNSEDAVVAKVGRDLYERLFRGYTRKHWALDPSELDASVCARIPIRTSTDDRYFGDSFQFMPKHGYTKMFENILDHPLIQVEVGTDYAEVANLSRKLLVWTGPIDAYFDERLGKLPYRSLRFEAVGYPVINQGYLQPVTQVNFPSEDVAYTRTVEYRHATGQMHDHSSLYYEYPTDEGDPYYPIPRPQNRELYERYVTLAEAERDTVFVGRLARYQYLNMDQVVAQALQAAEKAFGAERKRNSNGRVGSRVSA